MKLDFRGTSIATTYALALLWGFLLGPTGAAMLTGKADIVDGDTIKVGSIPVRLDGIDAPEGRQNCERDGKAYACGKQATKVLANLIAGQSSAPPRALTRNDLALTPRPLLNEHV